jgi:hypothetical protein
MIEDLWYKNAVMYSLDLETFMDQNGDGTGDLAGEKGRHHITLDAYGYRWFRAENPAPLG